MATGTLITHQISAQCTQQFPRHEKGVRTCARADAPHPWLVESTLLITPNPNTKFEHHRPSHSRDAEARCARAHVQRYTTHDLWKAHSSWPTTHSPNSNTIGQAVPEIQKRGVHVRTCRRRYPAAMPFVKCIANGHPTTYQISTQSAEPLLSYSNISFLWHPSGGTRHVLLLQFTCNGTSLIHCLKDGATQQRKPLANRTHGSRDIRF